MRTLIIVNRNTGVTTDVGGTGKLAPCVFNLLIPRRTAVVDPARHNVHVDQVPGHVSHHSMIRPMWNGLSTTRNKWFGRCKFCWRLLQPIPSVVWRRMSAARVWIVWIVDWAMFHGHIYGHVLPVTSRFVCFTLQ